MKISSKKLLIEVWHDTWRSPLHAAVYYIGNVRFLLTRQAVPLLTALAIDYTTHGTLQKHLVVLASSLALVEVTMYLMGALSRYTRHRLQEKISWIRYARYLEQAHNLNYDILTNRSRGDIASKVKSKADYIAQFLDFTRDTPQILLNIVISFVVLMSKNHILAYIYIGLWIPSSYTFYRVAKGRIGMNKKANQSWDSLMGMFNDSISNADTVSQYGNSKAEAEHFKSATKSLWQSYTKRWKAARQQNNLVNGFDSGITIILAIFGLYFVAKGQLTIGTYFLLQTYVGSTTEDIRNVADIFRNFSEQTIQATALDDLEIDHPRLPEPQSPIKPVDGDLSVCFDGVSFTYLGAKDSALRDFDLDIPSGQHVGIVGRSGSGKSTLTKLLLRLYAVDSGQLKICGVNVSYLGSTTTRAQIAYVPQDPILFHRSIKDNICFGAANINKKSLDKALNLSHSLEFVKELPAGVDTLVGDRGVKLSGGQRQRVAIARAIMKNSPILLFDEATSALDSESESAVQQAMLAVMDGKTTIVIAHRLSTLKHMDRIIVMDKGKIMEDGSHSQLLESKGLYAKLWAHQSGGFIES